MSEPTLETEERGWIGAARSGDQIAFGRLVTRHKDPVFATLLAITGDFDAAHDLAQETFLRAWFALARLDDAAAFGPWLCTIARNRGRTWLEKKRRQPARGRVDVDDLADRGRSPHENAERSERRRLVLAALDRLPDTSREVLLLHYMEGLTTPRLATLLGIAEAAVRQRLRRARLQMQEEVEEMVADVIRDERPGQEFADEVQELLAQTRARFHDAEYAAAAPLLERARACAPEDPLVSLLLADAYCFARTPDQLQADRGACERAMALYDEILAREPGNLLVRLRRAALSSVSAPAEEVFAQARRLRDDAAGGPYESVAQLELARRHAARGQAGEALAIYEQMLGTFPWMACVVHSEMGVAGAVTGDGAAAIGHFERAVELTTPAAMQALQERTQQLLGEAYWAYWSTVDNVSVRQAQNHAWLAGLRAVSGDMAKARGHVRQALRHLDDDEVGAARAILRRELVDRMEQMFPAVAAEPEIQELKRRIEAQG